MNSDKYDIGGNTNGESRLPYRKPELTEFGTLREMTLFVNGSGTKGDGGTPASSNKTS